MSIESVKSVNSVEYIKIVKYAKTIVLPQNGIRFSYLITHLLSSVGSNKQNKFFAQTRPTVEGNVKIQLPMK